MERPQSLMHAPLAIKYRAEWRAFAELEAIADEWRALAARAIEPNVFYEPAFALPAAQVFGQDAGAVLVRRQSGQLAGLFPAQRKRRGLVKGYVHAYAPLSVPLVDSNDTESVIEAWIAHLSQSHHALMMPLLTADGAFAKALARVCEKSNLRIIDFGAYDRAQLAPGERRADYLEPASKGRKRLIRQRRRLAELGDVTHLAASGDTVATDLIPAFLKLEEQGWKGRAGTAARSDGALARFFEQAVSGLAREGKAQGDILSLAGEPIAAFIVLRSNDSAWAWKVSYDERFKAYSPGVQAALDATRTLLDDETIARGDSCTAPGPHMIDHLWRERLAITDRLIALHPGQSLQFIAISAAESMRRFARDLAKATLRRVRP
jgi:CelD/BcsL family acetyltransferase involved in cellulose biosynthesis